MKRYLRLLSLARHTWQRFPFTLLITWLAGILLMLQTERNSLYLLSYEFTALVGALIFLNLELYRERYAPETPAHRYLALWGIIPILLYFQTFDETLTVIDYTRFGLLGLGLLLGVMYMPFVAGQPILGFWHYNEHLLGRLLLMLLYGGVFFMGLSIALSSIDTLFDTDIPQRWFVHLLILTLAGFGVWFFLAGIPDKIGEWVGRTHYPQILEWLGLYVLFPLLSLYLMILYVYMTTMVVSWNLPRGSVAYLIMAYAGGGMFTLALLNPLQHKHDFWFRRWFWLTLLPLLVLLYVSIGRRIRDYGITESRYLVLCFTLWLTLLSGYYLWSRRKRLDIVPVTLSLMLLGILFGPWSIFHISQQSQIARMERLWQKYGLLEQGKLNRQKSQFAQITERDAREIGNIIRYLGEREALLGLQPYFYASLDSLLSAKSKRLDLISKEERLLNLIGNAELTANVNLPVYERENTFTAHTDNPLQKIRGYDYVLRFSSFRADDAALNIRLDDRDIRVKAYFLESKVRIYSYPEPEALVTIDLNPMLNNLFNAKSPQVSPAAMTLLESSDRYKVRFQINKIRALRREPGDHQLQSIEGNLWLWFKP